MKATPLLLALASCFLCSCFFNPQDMNNPSQPPQSTPQVRGAVIMEDLSGDQSAAAVMGGFWKVAQTHTASSVAAFQAVQQIKEFSTLILGVGQMAVAGPQCSYPTAVASTLDNAAHTNFVSAGDMSYAPALSDKLFPVAQDSTHRYLQQIDTNFPTGIYQVKVGGTQDVPGFQVAAIPVPEPLSDVTVNGVTKAPVVKKSDSLKFQWRAPAMPHTGNILQIDVFSTTDKGTVKLECVGWEKDFYTHATDYQWEIPAAMLANLPASTNAEVDFGRVQYQVLSGTNLQVEFDGIRTFATAATIQ